MTPSMQEVLRIVTRLANAGGEMPNNPVLGELAGGRGRSSVLRALRRLAGIGLVQVERQGSRRRCLILASGRVTAWGEARPGHSPYVHRRPGEPPAPARPRIRRPESRPLPPRLPVEEPPTAMARRDLVGNTGAPANSAGIARHTGEIVERPARLRLVAEAPGSVARRACGPMTCQFPLWADGEKPGPEPKFCDSPAASGRSFCAAHEGSCFRKSHRSSREPRLVRLQFDTAA